MDCHRRDADAAVADSSSPSSATVSPTSSNSLSEDSPSSADSLPSFSASTGYSSAGETSSADSSFTVAGQADGADAATPEEEVVQLRHHPPASKARKHGVSRKVRPRLSNDLFAPARDILDDGHDYDQSSGDSGHVIATERELFGEGRGGDEGPADVESIPTTIVEEKEMKNEAPPPAPNVAGEAPESNDDRVEYVGTGGEIWMEGERCDSCDGAEEEVGQSGMDGYVTARMNLATVKPGVLKDCPHHQESKQQKAEKTKKKAIGKNGKSEARKAKREKSAATKSSSQQSMHISTSSKTDTPHPSKPHDHHNKHNYQMNQAPIASASVDSATFVKAPSALARPVEPRAPPSVCPLPAHSDRPTVLPGGQTLNKENLASLVTEFNQKSKGLSLNILEDGVTVRGFIRVHLDLMRPGMMEEGNIFGLVVFIAPWCSRHSCCSGIIDLFLLLQQLSSSTIDCIFSTLSSSSSLSVSS